MSRITDPRLVIRTAGLAAGACIAALFLLSAPASADIVAPREPEPPRMVEPNPAAKAVGIASVPVESSSAVEPEPVQAPVGVVEAEAPAASEQPVPHEAQGAAVEAQTAAVEAEAASVDALAAATPVISAVRSDTRMTSAPKRSAVVTAPPAEVEQHAAVPGVRERAAAFISDLVSACAVGAASAPGGPALAVAVMAMVLGMGRLPAVRARFASDEDVPEFLYAWDVIAPG